MIRSRVFHGPGPNLHESPFHLAQSPYLRDNLAMALEVLESLLSLPEGWNALAERARNPFASSEWIVTWWKHFGEGREPVVGMRRDPGGALVAAAPLYVWRRHPLRMGRFIGHGQADFLGPVYAPEHREAAARVLAATLDEAGCNALLAERLHAGTPLPQGWTGRRLLEESSPVLELEGSWDDFLASRSSNFRQQVRRRERNLARDHELRYRLTEDTETLEEDFMTLGRLHRARWGRTSATTSPAPTSPSTSTSPPSRSSAAGCGCGRWSWMDGPWRAGTGCASGGSSGTTRPAATPSSTPRTWASCFSRTPCERRWPTG